MSIVALKRKTAAKYGNHSAPNGKFSLNGVHRFVGVGPTNLAKSVTRTPFVGLDPKGHGGGSRCRVGGEKGRATKCSGPSGSTVVHLSGSNLTTQTEVKPSVMNTRGMLEQRYTGILHGAYPNSWVMPQKQTAAQRQETRALRELYERRCVCPETEVPPCNRAGSGCAAAPYTKESGTMTSSEHQRRDLNIKRFSGQWNFPFALHNDGCNKNYLRAEDVHVELQVRF